MASFAIKLDSPVLSSRRYDKDFTEVPNKHLPEKIQKAIKFIFEAAGYEYDPEDNTWLIKSVKGVYDSNYAPAIYKGNSGEAVIRWGSQVYPLERFLKAKTAEWNVGVDDSGKRPILTLALFPEDEDFEEGISMDFTFRFEDWQNPPVIPVINKALKDGKVAKYLTTIPTKSYKMHLLGEGEFKVIGYSSRDGQYGTQYTLKVEVGSDGLSFEDEGGKVTLAPKSVIGVYSVTNVDDVLKAYPDISPESPAILRIVEIYQTKNGGFRPRAGLEVASGAFKMKEGDFSLNW